MTHLRSSASSTRSIQTVTCDMQALETERIALIELFDATGGVSWYRHENWTNHNISICDWQFVICDCINITHIESTIANTESSAELPEVNTFDSGTSNTRSFTTATDALP